jgi:serralysin
MCVMCAVHGFSASWTTFDHALEDADTVLPEIGEATGATTGATGMQNVDALLSGRIWDGALTYSFPDSAGDFEANYTEAGLGFAQVSFRQMQAARYILEGMSPYAGGPRMGLTAVEQFTNLSISDAGFDSADIRIGQSPRADPTAYAYYPGATPTGGDIWFGSRYNYGDPKLGNYSYQTMIHELGHALGLKHGHVGGGVGNVALTPDRDSLEFSVMTYRSYIGHPMDGYSNESYGYPQTYMMYDIAALQAMYGANFTANSGNTVYRWDAKTGETFVNGVGQGAPGNGAGGYANRIFLTIWDGGGVDTYDLSNYTENASIDLTPGGWSSFSGVQRAYLGMGNYARGNVFNALQYQGDARSLIENATGGSGSDIITGNAAANRLLGQRGNDVLYGNDGNDILSGGLGSDILHGGEGADSLDGGEGFDYARYDEADYAGFTASLLYAAWNTGVAAGDVFVGIEGLILSNGDDLGYGTIADNYLYGRAGDDTFFAFAGQDSLFGEDGNDNLIGGEGHDFLFGGLGGDILQGQEGFDYARYDEASYAGFVVSLTSPSLNTGVAAGDLFVGIEGLILSGGADVAYGDHTGNYIYARAGNDVLYGYYGNDWLFGEAGADSFVFNMAPSSMNQDVIGDFVSGVDRIVLAPAYFGTANAGGGLVRLAQGAGIVAPTAKATILFDTASKLLSFDPDGNGPLQSDPIATVMGTGLAQTDLFFA